MLTYSQLDQKEKISEILIELRMVMLLDYLRTPGWRQAIIWTNAGILLI